MSDRIYARDFLGRIILVKDKVVYPSRRGSSMYMNYAEVIAIEKVHTEWSGKTVISLKLSYISGDKYRKPGSISTVTKLENVTIVDTVYRD